jgi:hypothetical protein
MKLFIFIPFILIMPLWRLLFYIHKIKKGKQLYLCNKYNKESFRYIDKIWIIEKNQNYIVANSYDVLLYILYIYQNKEYKYYTEYEYNKYLLLKN